MIKSKVVYSLIFSILTTSTSFSQIGGTRAFAFLETPNHARVAGLGTVNVSSTVADVNMLWQNPALLNPDMNGELAFSLNPYFASIYNSQLTYAQHLEKMGIFGFGISYLNYGDFDGFDNTGKPSERFSASDYVIQITHSRQEGVFQYGASIKWVATQISGFRQSAFLTDLGGAFIHPEKDLSAALVVKNLGFFTSRTQADDRKLPFDVQLGGTFKPEFMPFRFSLNVNRLYQFDLSYFDESLLSDNGNTIFTDVSTRAPTTFDKIFQHVTVGTEVLLGKSLSIRAGYNHLIRSSLKAEQVGGLGGFTYGLSFQTKKFNVAYSNATYQAGGFAHFITLGSNLKEFIKKK